MQQDSEALTCSDEYLTVWLPAVHQTWLYMYSN